ncbi:MAG: hypothetical protein R3F07_10745 [Opitutaceae bacterium]
MNRPVTKNKGPRSAAGNAIWNAFSTFWGIAISFVLAPLLIKNLGTDQYGILLIIWSVTGMLGVMNFGMGEATLRYVALYFGKDDLSGVNRVMGSTLTFYLVVCLLAGTGLFLGSPYLVNVLRYQPTRPDWWNGCCGFLPSSSPSASSRGPMAPFPWRFTATT